MKWNITNILLLLAGIITGYLLWQNWTKSQLINQLQMTNLEKQVDTMKIETTKSVIEYQDRIKTNTKIVDKWNLKRDTFTQTNIDTLYLQAQTDIQYLDTSLQKCDLALLNCLKLSDNQTDYINALQSKKSPLIVPNLSIGLSMNKDLVVYPALSAGFGFNLNKIFGKK